MYLEHADKSLHWEAYDSQERYNNNIKTQYALLKKYGWLDKEIIYKFNKHGFRCPDFDNKPCIMFLGCSHTLGLGLNIEDTWSYLVHQTLNLGYVNLGQAGSSHDTAFRLAYYWIPKLKPKIVFLLKPEISRCEIAYNGFNNFFAPCMFDEEIISDKKEYLKWYKLWVSEDSNYFLNSEKNTLGINEICRRYNSKFYYLDTEYFLSLECRVDLARDLSHLGILSNRLFAEKVLSVINN